MPFLFLWRSIDSSLLPADFMNKKLMTLHVHVASTTPKTPMVELLHAHSAMSQEETLLEWKKLGFSKEKFCQTDNHKRNCILWKRPSSFVSVLLPSQRSGSSAAPGLKTSPGRLAAPLWLLPAAVVAGRNVKAPTTVTLNSRILEIKTRDEVQKTQELALKKEDVKTKWSASTRDFKPCGPSGPLQFWFDHS